MLEDDYLFSLTQQGDEKAFAAIYNKYHKILYALAFDYLKDTDLAKDIVQEVFLRLWELRMSINVQVNLGNYLYTITKNQLLKVIQERNKEILQAYEFNRQIQVSHSDTNEKVRSEHKEAELYKVIDKLPNQKKEICLLKLRKDLSNQQIAEHLGISIQTVKNHYNQSLKFLKIHLKGSGAFFFLW